jgi:hypothetical protein
LVFFFLLERHLQIQSGINNSEAIKYLEENALASINNGISDIEFIGQGSKSIPQGVSLSQLETVIEAHCIRNDLLFDDSRSMVYFGKARKYGKIYYSASHLSSARERYSRAVSSCLVLLDEK